MKEGKLPNDILKNKILDMLPDFPNDVLIKPSVGEDCSAIAFGEDACVLTTDPITGAVNDVGRLAVHVSCNDVASCGVKPFGIMVAILVPPTASLDEITTVTNQINQTAAELGVFILGGHTELTSAVTRFVIVTTAIGKSVASKLIKSSSARPGDALVMTKAAGLEGTAILAVDRKSELKNILSEDALRKAAQFVNEISVVKEGILAGRLGAHAMHDVTEGGILGAVWELAEASGIGVVVEADAIPVREETRLICQHFDLNPLKLISSGSMLIACPDGKKMINALKSEDVEASCIGHFTDSQQRIIIVGNDKQILNPPEEDELYKA